MPETIAKTHETLTRLEKISNTIMYWIGSTQSLVVHTIVFIASFMLPMFDIINFDTMLAVLTNVLSLEAIYLAIFIQMSVNKSSEHIEDLRDDVIEIQEDIEDIQEDIEEISEDIEEISEDIEEISDDIEDIQEDIEEINEDENEEDHNERARNVMLKSNVSHNKTAIKTLQEKILKMEAELEKLRGEELQKENE